MVKTMKSTDSPYHCDDILIDIDIDVDSTHELLELIKTVEERARREMIKLSYKEVFPFFRSCGFEKDLLTMELKTRSLLFRRRHAILCKQNIIIYT